jgi:PII-like signaling protein
MSTELLERARLWCASVRRKPVPLSEAIPMVTELIDRVEELERIVFELEMEEDL